MTHIEIPHACVTAEALRSLATMLERLEKFHGERGGADVDLPCLRALTFVHGILVARLTSGGRTFKIGLHQRGGWAFV